MSDLRNFIVGPPVFMEWAGDRLVQVHPRWPVVRAALAELVRAQRQSDTYVVTDIDRERGVVTMSRQP